jgi:hypothetical protein
MASRAAVAVCRSSGTVRPARPTAAAAAAAAAPRHPLAPLPRRSPAVGHRSSTTTARHRLQWRALSPGSGEAGEEGKEVR